MPKTRCRKRRPPTSIAASFRARASTSTLAKLKELAGPKVTVTANMPIRPIGIPPKLDPKITGPMKTLADKYFPGVPLLPSMSTGATDGIFLEAIGIPVYGAPGIFVDSDFSGVHGLNERIRVEALYSRAGLSVRFGEGVRRIGVRLSKDAAFGATAPLTFIRAAAAALNVAVAARLRRPCALSPARLNVAANSV